MSRRAVALVGALMLTVAACDDGGSPSAGSAKQADSPSTSAATSSAPVVTTTGEPNATPAATAAPTTTFPPFEPAAIEWEPFNDTVDVGTLEVPVDYADPDGPKFELFLARYNALDPANKVGTLLVNPGGPGFGGAEMALAAAQRFDRTLRDRFDIIGWDPRGTGESDPPIDCIDDYDAFFAALDHTPDDDAERTQVVELAQQFAAGCENRSGEILAHVGTNASARDIDTIRRSLGEEQISYFGFSYGSELGGVWATLFPDTVRAAVFDGAADPDATREQSTLQQLTGFEAALDRFLEQCSADEECPFHSDGDAAAAFDALMADLDATPVSGDPDRPPVNRDVAIGAVILGMYSEQYWPALATSLAAARDGDGSGLLALWDSYYQRQGDGTWGNQLEAFQAISCADDPERLTVEQSDALVTEQRTAGPRLVPEGSVGSYACTFFPPSTDPRIEIGAGPDLAMLVIGTTGDPSTPLESTEKMVERLADGRLVVVTANQHTGYGVNRCVIDAVNAYLVDLTAPENTLQC